VEAKGEERGGCGRAISASSFLSALLKTSSHRPMPHFCSWQADHRGQDLVWPLGHITQLPKAARKFSNCCGFKSQNP